MSDSPGAAGGGGPPAPGAAPGGIGAAFTYRNFRYQFGADALSSWSFEMETLILAWYVLVETDSAFLLAVVAALRFGGTLLSPIFGVYADRLSRRGLLVAMRIGFALLAGSLMAADLTGRLELWHVFTVAAVAGLIRPSEMVIRQSLVADTVPGPVLMNALGFSRITMDSARIAGALLGAGLLSTIGFGPAYIAVTGFYAISALLTARIGAAPRTAAAHAAPWEDLLLGLRYIRSVPAVGVALGLAFLVNLTAFPLTQGLLPVVARDTYGLDENGLARMVAAVATGAIVGALVLAVPLRHARPERIMLGGIAAWHLLIVAFLHVESPVAASVALVLIGIAVSAAMIPMSVVIMGRTDARYRGRVMGVRMLAVYGLPVGLLVAGGLIEWVGLVATLTFYGGAGLAIALVVALRWSAWSGSNR